MILSNLPMKLLMFSSNSDKTIVAITYWGDGPNSFLLGERVRSVLESKTSEFGIESIRADFLPKLTCK